MSPKLIYQGYGKNSKFHVAIAGGMSNRLCDKLLVSFSKAQQEQMDEYTDLSKEIEILNNKKTQMLVHLKDEFKEHLVENHPEIIL